MDITLRAATKNDLPALNRLLPRPEDYFERCLKEGRVILVAALDGDDAGCGMLNWNPQYAFYRKLGIPEIQDVAVLPAARRRGVATAIIQHCEKLASEKNCAHIGISVGLTAPFGAAQRLYVKLGYVPDGNGVTCDRQPVGDGEFRPIDENVCLMMVKDLKASP